MKKSFLVAAVVACLVALSAVAQLTAQGPVRPSGGGGGGGAPGVAVVDVELIFRNLTGFKAQMESMSKEVKAAEATLNEERLKINKMIEQLKDSQFGKNSPQFRKLEADIAQKQADFQVRKQLQTRDFMEREASVYYKTYLEINETIRYYAESRGIALVLRYSNNPVDPTDRESVFRELNKPVLYQHGSDITSVITEELNRRNVAASANGPGGPRGSGGRPVGPGPGGPGTARNPASAGGFNR